jgi:hypothetical protein
LRCWARSNLRSTAGNCGRRNRQCYPADRLLAAQRQDTGITVLYPGSLREGRRRRRSNVLARQIVIPSRFPSPPGPSRVAVLGWICLAASRTSQPRSVPDEALWRAFVHVTGSALRRRLRRYFADAARERRKPQRARSARPRRWGGLPPITESSRPSHSPRTHIAELLTAGDCFALQLEQRVRFPPPPPSERTRTASRAVLARGLRRSSWRRARSYRLAHSARSQ